MSRMMGSAIQNGSSINFMENDAEAAKKLVIQHDRLRLLWNDVNIKSPVRETEGPFHVGESFRISTTISKTLP